MDTLLCHRWVAFADVRLQVCIKEMKAAEPAALELLVLSLK